MLAASTRSRDGLCVRKFGCSRSIGPEHIPNLEETPWRAYTGLAFSKFSLGAQSASGDIQEEALSAAMKAVETGDADEETYAIIAAHHAWRKEVDEMDAWIAKALAVNPNNPMVIYWYPGFCSKKAI
ncbi:MAG: hypothetical protein EXQ94_10760 [Alphaproteobacteria bacterium]|nr:hypothetical protein [Alphaproteobacteria bacterium]